MRKSILTLSFIKSKLEDVIGNHIAPLSSRTTAFLPIWTMCKSILTLSFIKLQTKEGIVNRIAPKYKQIQKSACGPHNHLGLWLVCQCGGRPDQEH